MAVEKEIKVESKVITFFTKMFRAKVVSVDTVVKVQLDTDGTVEITTVLHNAKPEDFKVDDLVHFNDKGVYYGNTYDAAKVSTKSTTTRTSGCTVQTRLD